MSKNEKGFQSYFMSLVKDKNYYRTALTNGTGYPDITADHGDLHSFIELKDIILGKKGDRLLKQCFENSQPPWYIQHIARGGKRLFIVFRIRDWDESNRRYGLWWLTSSSAKALASNEISYSNLCNFAFKTFRTLKDLIAALEYEE